MRLRTLSEAECYARCYGARSEERVSVVRRVPHSPRSFSRFGEGIRERFEQRLDARGPEREAA
ncbi:MAG TPA: hypothetical protein VFA82_02520 [Gaiellaceae bacterium]|nr:hypothetical protein [Gaiellaceae bacterium]